MVCESLQLEVWKNQLDSEINVCGFVLPLNDQRIEQWLLILAESLPQVLVGFVKTCSQGSKFFYNSFCCEMMISNITLMAGQSCFLQDPLSFA